MYVNDITYMDRKIASAQEARKIIDFNLSRVAVSQDHAIISHWLCDMLYNLFWVWLLLLTSMMLYRYVAELHKHKGMKNNCFEPK